MGRMEETLIKSIQRSKSHLRRTVLFACGFLVMLSLGAEEAHAQDKPKFRNGESVEVLNDRNRRWYKAKIWKVKKGNPPQYNVRFEGFPSSVNVWVKEEKVRKKGGGVTVDVNYIRADVALRKLFGQLNAMGKGGKWGDDRWNAQLDKLVARIDAGIANIKKNYPKESTEVYEKTIKNRKGQIAALRQKAAAKKAKPANEPGKKSSPTPAAPAQLAELVLEPEGPPGAYFNNFINLSKLDPKTGKMDLPPLSLTRLPSKDKSGQIVTYGNGKGEHSLVAVVYQGDKEILKAPYRASAPSKGRATTAKPLKTRDGPVVKAAGDYLIELRLDGKAFYRFPFEVIQNKTGFHFGAPWANSGYIIWRRPTDNLVWKMYFSDTTGSKKYHVRAKLWHKGKIIGVNDDDQTVYTQPGRWKRENIFFKGADRRNLTPASILKSDGEYMLQVLVNKTELSYYKFNVKGGKVYVPAHDRAAAPKFQFMEEVDKNMFWLNGIRVELPGKNRRPTTPGAIGAVKENFSLLVASGKTMKGFKDGEEKVFQGGNYLYGNFQLSDAQEKQYVFKDIIYTTTLLKGDKMVAQHTYCEEHNGKTVNVFLIPNPKNYPNPQWTGKFAIHLAKLAAGKHKLKLVVEMEDDVSRKVVSWCNLTYDNSGGNGDYVKLAAVLQRKAGLSPQEAAEDFNKNNPPMIIKGGRWPFPHIERADGKAVSGVSKDAWFDGRKVGRWYGKENYAIGIFKMGHRMASKYTTTKGDIVEFAAVNRIIKFNRKEIAKIDGEGYIIKNGKKWGRLYNTDLADWQTIIKLLVPAYHSTDLFK